LAEVNLFWSGGSGYGKRERGATDMSFDEFLMHASCPPVFVILFFSFKKEDF